jgi:hypothetical protein
MDFVSHLDISDDGKAMLVAAGVEAMSRTAVAWSPEEIALVRQHYPTGGASKCAEHLPRRTLGAISLKAKALKLPKPPFKKHAAAFTTTPHIDAAIKRHYANNPKRGGLSKLAHQIARPVGWVSRRAVEMGIQRPRFDSPKWSERELEILRASAWRVPGAIARILRREGFRRSTNAIHLKLTRLRCDRTNDDVYTALGLSELFGVDKGTVTTWIKRGLLKAGARGTDHPNDAYLVHHNSVRRFVIENAAAVDIRRVDKDWFIDLLANTVR